VRRSAATQIEAPGQDSFLDVVCNLVGILIVLVMLIAAQAKRGMVAAASLPAQSSAASGLAEEAAAAEAAAGSIELSINELQAKINRQNLEAALRQQERDRVQALVTIAEQRLAEHRNKLTGHEQDRYEQDRYDLEQQLAAAQRELKTLQSQEVTLGRPPVKVLEHLPTPMARTVFGGEMHFRLLGGRLAYVPWQEMLERMKADAPQHVQKLKNLPRVELSLPAIDGFGARYILRKVDAQMQTRVGTATHSAVELEQVYFVDAESNIGQLVAAALQPNSAFRGRLAEHKPQATTVTIWVYPDSFDDFRTIKAELFKLGYLTAARPLPAGYPIAGGPEGSRSSAE
jgi:hypothetical protein